MDIKDIMKIEDIMKIDDIMEIKQTMDIKGIDIIGIGGGYSKGYWRWER